MNYISNRKNFFLTVLDESILKQTVLFYFKEKLNKQDQIFFKYLSNRGATIINSEDLKVEFNDNIFLLPMNLCENLSNKKFLNKLITQFKCNLLIPFVLLENEIWWNKVNFKSILCNDLVLLKKILLKKKFKDYFLDSQSFTEVSFVNNSLVKDKYMFKGIVAIPTLFSFKNIQSRINFIEKVIKFISNDIGKYLYKDHNATSYDEFFDFNFVSKFFGSISKKKLVFLETKFSFLIPSYLNRIIKLQILKKNFLNLVTKTSTFYKNEYANILCVEYYFQYAYKYLLTGRSNCIWGGINSNLDSYNLSDMEYSGYQKTKTHYLVHEYLFNHYGKQVYKNKMNIISYDINRKMLTLNEYLNSIVIDK